MSFRVLKGLILKSAVKANLNAFQSECIYIITITIVFNLPLYLSFIFIFFDYLETFFF